MSYATAPDIVDLYGPSALYVADRDNDGTVDAAAVDRALVSASDEIDSHVGVRHALPLAAVPGILRQHCVDIAVYRLALSADVLTEEHRRRYEDAVAHLRRIAEGKAALVLPADPDAPTDPDAPEMTGPRPIVASGPPRLFTRGAMRDF
ncbi:DUF1320 domain-containing protein [Paracoccus sediminis]|uniref:DUF1320 domain-containing protein n=1 Tax=Paracoccus sediminis TaxID=1214787 RepID=A0A238UN16_9RHOB|nr:DUF1320 domain-containing protein [Paracoccus sediminis]TBN53134.1 DUF1320 domain-containing protein [Paracoccus sediminis]SNR22893.1 Mu-like prophage protein gp36 [Paracoccus sediminis]